MPNTKIFESGEILPIYYDSETGKPVAKGTEGARSIYKLITDGAEPNSETELLNYIVDIVFVEKTNAYEAAHPDEYKEAVYSLVALDAKDKEAPAVAVAEVARPVSAEETVAAPVVAVAATVAPAHDYNSDYVQFTPTQLMLGVCGVLAFGICLGNSLHHGCHPNDFHDL